jgi:hypothetical protein
MYITYEVKRKVTVYLVSEHDNAKDEKRYEDYMKFVAEEWVPYIEKNLSDICKITSLSDNTGHIIGIYEFEDLETFGKMWNDKEWMLLMIKASKLVDNNSYRLCRPAIVREPE